ncbi:MAG: monovalent cation:proton antiporter family protein [Candidatus Bipolaricaulia bacterium]
MQEAHSGAWISLLIVASLAFLVPLTLSRLKTLRIPVVVGEILAGIAVGQSGLGIIEPDQNEWLNVLSTLGFTYLLFLAGLEIDFDVLGSSARGHWRKTARTFGVPVAYFVLMLAASFGAALLLQTWGLVQNPFLMALVLGTTSLGIVMPVLRERGLSGYPIGQSILLATILADFGTMLLLTAAVAIEQGSAADQVLLVFVLIVAVLVVDRVLHRFQNSTIFNSLFEATAEVGVRGSFLLMFVFVALSDLLGVEFILGAFLAGVLVSLAVGRIRGAELRRKLDAIGFGFFIPIFFIMVGARFDIGTLTGSVTTLLLIPALLVLRYVAKIVPALVYRFQYDWRRTWATGWILSPGLTLMIAAADVGMRAGLIEDTMNNAIILLAIVTSTASPLVFDRLMPTMTSEPKRRLLLVGVNEHTLMLARHLPTDTFDDVRFVELDPRSADHAESSGFTVIRARGITEEELIQAGIDADAIVVAATGDDETNCRVAELARQRFECDHVVALVEGTDATRELKRIGVQAVTPALSKHFVLRSLVHDPDFFAMMESDAIRMHEVELRAEELDRREVQDLTLPQGVLILYVHRDREHLIPSGSTELRAGDRLTLLGPPAAIQEVEDDLSFK